MKDMNITKNLSKAVVLALWLIPALSSCTTDDDNTLPESDDARAVSFEIPARTLCGGVQTRVSQDVATAKWEEGDVLYVYATFTIPDGKGNTTLLNKMGVLKCADPAVNYWKYALDNEIERLTPGFDDRSVFQTPLRWPINATKGTFRVVYAGSKLSYGYSEGANLKFSNDGLKADVGIKAIAGQVDVMQTTIKEVEAGTRVMLPPYSHLLTRLRVTGGGNIFAADEYSRIATVAEVNLYTGMVTSVIETGDSYKPFVPDGKDYFAIVNRQQYTGDDNYTADGKPDDTRQSIRITVKPDGKDAYTRVLVRPVEPIAATPLVYAGTAYTVKPTTDGGTGVPGDIGITPEQPKVPEPPVAP